MGSKCCADAGDNPDVPGITLKFNGGNPAVCYFGSGLKPISELGLHTGTSMHMYQGAAARTMADYKPEERAQKLAILGLGIAGEAGEVADLLKKYLGHGHQLDPDKLTKELGDVLWYVAGIASMMGISLEAVALVNLDKLKARYPEGFSEAASKARVDLGAR